MSLIIGAWIFISPWVLGFAGAPDQWNFLIVGGAVFILAIWDLSLPVMQTFIKLFMLADPSIDRNKL